MKVFIGFEFSGRVRDAFAAQGHDAISCDLLPSESPGPHITRDIYTFPRDYFSDFNLCIFFPPCTHLCSSGARWFPLKREMQARDVANVAWLAKLPCNRIAIENPIGVLSTRFRKPDQIIQPWQFGHGETKATCLWLKNLPHLKPTEIVSGREPRVHRASPGPDRWKIRSVTYAGIARAMADQWGKLP
jgi:hypothetical protein